MLGCDCVIDYLDSVHLTLESAKIRSRQVPNSIITEEYVHGEI